MYYYTPYNVRYLMIKLIKPKLYNNGIIEKVFDPAMGTGNLLLSVISDVTNQSYKKNIKINWNYICNSGITGNEDNIIIRQQAILNILNVTGHVFNNLHYKYINKPIDKKYSIIISDPAFIKLNFIKNIIDSLYDNGRCVIILSKNVLLTNNDKQYLIQNSEIKDIVKFTKYNIILLHFVKLKNNTLKNNYDEDVNKIINNLYSFNHIEYIE